MKHIVIEDQNNPQGEDIERLWASVDLNNPKSILRAGVILRDRRTAHKMVYGDDSQLPRTRYEPGRRVEEGTQARETDTAPLAQDGAAGDE